MSFFLIHILWNIFSETSLFCFGNHTKKRPNSIIIGRMFDYHLLDMVEFSVESYKPLQNSGFSIGHKPLFVFLGDLFQNSSQLQGIQNILLDFFEGPRPLAVNLLGFDYLIGCSAQSESRIHLALYKVDLKAKGRSGASVTLTEIGPVLDLKIMRKQFPSEELRKTAYMIPQELRKGKGRNKNVTFDELGSKEGRLHIQQENIQGIALRRFSEKGDNEKMNLAIQRHEQTKEKLLSKKRKETTTSVEEQQQQQQQEIAQKKPKLSG